MYQDLVLKVSFGQGSQAKVPWVSFTGYEQTTSHGIYPVFLYYRSIGVLILALGVSETESPDVKWPDVESNTTVQDFLKNNYGHTPERYGASYVFSSYIVSNGRFG